VKNEEIPDAVRCKPNLKEFEDIGCADKTSKPDCVLEICSIVHEQLDGYDAEKAPVEDCP